MSPPPGLALPVRLLQTQTDARLLELARSGHERAFEALVARYRRPLLRYARRLLLPEARAEDALQQAYLSAWLALQGGTEVRDARAWLYRIFHNAAISALRRSGYDHEELSESLCGSDAPHADLERRLAVRQALAGLAALPELQREALLRTALEGHSHERVAESLGLSEGAVRGLVYRARATLRATATALIPPPMVSWLATGDRLRSPLAQRLAEALAGAGSAGAAGVVLKGGAVVLSAGALAAGAGWADPGTVSPASASASHGSPGARVHALSSAPRSAMRAGSASARPASHPQPSRAVGGQHHGAGGGGVPGRRSRRTKAVPLPVKRDAGPMRVEGENRSGRPSGDPSNTTDAHGGPSTGGSSGSGQGSQPGSDHSGGSPGGSGTPGGSSGSGPGPSGGGGPGPSGSGGQRDPAPGPGDGGGSSSSGGGGPGPSSSGGSGNSGAVRDGASSSSGGGDSTSSSGGPVISSET